jgi:hypothetical protein
MARPWWPSRSTSTSPSCFNFVAGRRSRPRPCSQVHRGTHSVASDTCSRGSSTRRSPPPRLTTSHRGSPRRRVAGDPPHHLPFFPAWEQLTEIQSQLLAPCLPHLCRIPMFESPLSSLPKIRHRLVPGVGCVVLQCPW